jgi:hypothetical protein
MVTRKEYGGGAAATTLAGGINAAVTSFSVAAGSSFPTGSTSPFVVVIDRGTASEEKCLILSRSGNTFTVSSRGYDGTSSTSHTISAAVEHCFDAVSADEANKAAAQTIGKVTTAGDLLVGTGSEAMKRLGLGTARQQLATNSTPNDLEWVASIYSILTTAGDMMYASSANNPVRLAKGTALQHLRMNAAATAPEWASSLESVVTTAGDTIYATGAGTVVRLPIGTARQVLATNAGATAPEWVASVQSVLTGTGDLLYSSGANTPARLAVGTSTYVLRSNGTTPEWAAAPALGELDSATVTASQSTITSQADLTSLTLTVTYVAGRKYRWRIVGEATCTVGDGAWAVVLTDGSNTQLKRATGPGSTAAQTFIVEFLETGTGSTTRKARMSKASGTGSVALTASADNPAYIICEDIGVA